MEKPEYSAERGVTLVWDHGFVLEAKPQTHGVAIRGNQAALRSLARHLLVLAQEGVPDGAHVHLDGGNELEDGSVDLVLERNDRRHV